MGYVSAFNAVDDMELNFDQRTAIIQKGIQENSSKVAQKVDGKLVGVSYDLVRELPNIIKALEDLREGDRDHAAVDLSLGQYVQERYGIATDAEGSSDNFLRLIGINKKNVTLSQLAGKAQVKLTAMGDFNKNFTWLVGETITEALRAMVNIRGIYRRLCASMETVPYDNITVPIYKTANGFFQQLREAESMKIGSVEYDEIQMITQDIGAGFKITDLMARNMRINMLQDWLVQTTGKNLDRQLTYMAIQRLLNGNLPSGADAAPVVGVISPGAFDYDNDLLEIVLAMSELGYNPSTILGSRGMMKELMALPEFKGFDGQTVKAELVDDVPLPSQYFRISTGAMPPKGVGGGKLLILDTRNALKHYTTKPLTLENQRQSRELLEEYYISMTTLFVKQMTDASIVLDSSVSIGTNPFPSIFDPETLDKRGF